MLELMRPGLGLAALLLAAGDLTAQDSATRRRAGGDTTRLEALEVRVTRGAEARLRVPAAVTVIDSGAFRGAQLQNGLDEALGRVPGLYVANRFNPSLDQRLAIRGAGARANFGIRGIKVLLDGIPQTLPDGQTQLTNLDLGMVDRVEVLSGASSALYGNAGGGVIAFTTASPFGPPVARVRGLGGRFGTSRVAGQVTGGTGPWGGSVGFARYASDGTRQQSRTEASQLAVAADRVLSPRWLLRTRYFFARSPEAENPGALTAAELAANPDSAAANNILRGADKSVTQHQLGFAARSTDDRGNTLELSLFGLTRDLVNPLATAPPGPTGPTVGTWSGSDRVAGGARVALERRLGGRGTRLAFGADFQTMRDDRENRRSAGGEPTDTVVADQRETVTEIGPFARLHLEPVTRMTVTGTARYDRVRFRVRDRHLADGVDQSGTRTMDAASGSAAASYQVGASAAVYASVASAFETPTTTELVNQANGTVGFNRGLDPQRTVTVEAGARTTGPVAASVAVYRAAVRDALVQAREQDGRAYFENAGRLTIRGVEAGLGWRVTPRLSLTASYGHSDARFTEYRLRNGTVTDTLDGREVPGIPRHLLRAVATVTLGRFTGEWDQQLVGRFYADDRNTLPVAGWGAGVTAIRLRADLPLGRTAIAPLLAVNNVWNRRYVAAATVNGFGGRVYEPAAGRWAFVGIEASTRLR